MKQQKSLTAYQYYVRAWKTMSAKEKQPYKDMVLRDIQKKEEKVIEQDIYLTAYTGGYSACGLDHGARMYETVGPVVNIIEYSPEEQEKWGVKVKEYQYYDGNGSYEGCKRSLYHNEKYFAYRGSNVYTYSKRYSKKRDRAYAPIKKFCVDANATEAGETTVRNTSF